MTRRRRERTYLPAVIPPAGYDTADDPVTMTPEEIGHLCKLMAKDGAFPEEWAAVVGLPPRQIERLAHQHPGLERDLRAAFALCAAWWGRWVRTNHDKKSYGSVLRMLRARLPTVFGADSGQVGYEARKLAASIQPDQAEPVTPEVFSGMSVDELQRRLEALKARQSS